MLLMGTKEGMMVRICVVEDEPNIIEAMRYLFEKEDWEVVVVSDGDKAFATIHETRPSLVVLDYMLPNQSGLAVARQLRGDGATASLPILMLSAKGQHKDKEQAHLAGINLFMTKPFTNIDLLDNVKQLLSANQK